MSKTIENLKKLKSFHNGSYGADIDKAIKALEQETVSRESYDHEYFLRKELETKTDKMVAHIGRKIASYYALLADGENTRKTKERLLAKIDMLLELLDEFNIGYEIIGNNEGVTINKRSYTYTIKDHARWSFCINEKKFVKCAESEDKYV